MHNVAEFSGLVLDLTTPQDALYASIAVDDDRMTGNPLGGKNVYCAEGGDGRYYGVYYRQSQAGGTVYHIKRTSSGSFGGASQFSLDLGTAVNSCPFGNEFTNTANDFVGLSPVNVDGDVTVECAISPAPPPPRPSVESYLPSPRTGKMLRLDNEPAECPACAREVPSRWVGGATFWLVVYPGSPSLARTLPSLDGCTNVCLCQGVIVRGSTIDWTAITTPLVTQGSKTIFISKGRRVCSQNFVFGWCTCDRYTTSW